MFFFGKRSIFTFGQRVWYSHLARGIIQLSWVNPPVVTMGGLTIIPLYMTSFDGNFYRVQQLWSSKSWSHGKHVSYHFIVDELILNPIKLPLIYGWNWLCHWWNMMKCPEITSIYGWNMLKSSIFIARPSPFFSGGPSQRSKARLPFGQSPATNGHGRVRGWGDGAFQSPGDLWEIH